MPCYAQGANLCEKTPLWYESTFHILSRQQILHIHILYVTHHLSLLNVVYVDKYFLIKPI